MAVPTAIRKILVWHRGALGDVLLSGPALRGLAAHYPAARFTLLGVPSRLALLNAALPVEALWDSHGAQWTSLFQAGPLPERLRQTLREFDLAVIFSPQPRPELDTRFREAGISTVIRIPTFPVQACVPVDRFQAQHLARWAIASAPGPLRLTLTAEEHQAARRWFETQEDGSPGQPCWIALAPGSGHPRKNWPLENYEKLARRLQTAWRARIVWIAGPAEASLTAKLKAFSRAVGNHLLLNLPLPALAARLSLCHLYIGGDSGITHLAAATGGPAVLALFGPTDPNIWAPRGEQITVLSAPPECAPCAIGREISCPEAHCLQQIKVEPVYAAAQKILARICWQERIPAYRGEIQQQFSLPPTQERKRS